MANSTEAYEGLKNEEAVRLYLKEEQMMSDYDIDDFMRVYDTLSISEVSEMLFEMIGKEIYRTYPPDMKTFIHDPYFLGTIYGDSIFPVWDNLLPEIYPAPLCKAYDEIILSTATRCFGKGTQIRMFDGSLKNVEDIVVGDVLMGPDGTKRTVLKIMSGQDDMYRVTPKKGGKPFVCNSQHTLALRKVRDHQKPNAYIEITVEEYLKLSDNQKGLLRLYHSEAIPYSHKEYIIDPYIFGTWLGDGHTASFRLTTVDEEIKEAWCEYSTLFEGYNFRASNKGKHWDIAISRPTYHTRHNIFTNVIQEATKTGHKRIPSAYLLGDIEQRRNLLAGIIDTDGYKRTECHYNITTKYADLAEDYATLARSLGFFVEVCQRNKKLSYKDEVYTSYDINITGDFTVIPCRLSRKQSSKKPVREYLTTEFNVEYIGKDNYYGFTVDKDHNVLHEDYTVLKNCGKSTCIAISFAYEIMLLLCMINPAKTILGKASGSLVMGILSKDNATAVGQVATDLYKILTLSPYFQTIIEGDLAFSNIEKKGVAITDSILVKAGSSLATIVGTDLFACCLDEANIGTTKIAAEKLVETRLQLWQHAIDRRNATLDKAPAGTGIMWITSSPTEENDVIKARIDQVNDSGIPNVRVVDNLARWEARGTHATDTFDFFIGSDTKDPCLLEDVPDLILSEEEAKERVIKVPRTVEYLSSFRNEPIRAIQEIAGLRTQAENAFFRSVAPFEKVFYLDNPIFSKDELHLTMNGNLDFDDYLIDKDYFLHCNRPNCYRYIHLDMASKQDRFGLASVYSDRLTFTSDDGVQFTKRMFFIDFVLGLKAQGGDAVDMLKALDYLYKLKKMGYPIKLITTDSHQGELARQYLTKSSNKTLETEQQSVEKKKDAYYNLKNAILTESLIGYKNPLLTKELKNLREDEKRVQKPKGDGYSDDLSDALAGALYSCSQDKFYRNTNEDTTSIITQFRQQQTWNQMYGRQTYNFRPIQR